MPKIGLLWRAEWDPPQQGTPVAESCRLNGVFAAFDALGVRAEPVIYADDRVDAVRAQLLRLDGVLVWVNPIEQGLDRSKLDPLLREVADTGVWVSAHPDVLSRLATKRVLFDTREMSWGTDTRLYLSAAALQAALPARLADGTARVLKQQRGMGGEGIWKVECAAPGDDTWLLVRHATRNAPAERLRVSEFAARCETYFEAGGLMVEQPFQERIGEGMIRVYLTHDEVVGFAHQYPAGLRPASAGEPPAGKRFEQAKRERVPSSPRPDGVRMAATAAAAPRPRHPRPAGDLGRRLPLRAEDCLGRHVRPLRDQRQLDLRLSRARDADSRERDTGAARRRRRRR